MQPATDEPADLRDGILSKKGVSRVYSSQVGKPGFKPIPDWNSSEEAGYSQRRMPLYARPGLYRDLPENSPKKTPKQAGRSHT
jgi:hypothetical protein